MSSLNELDPSQLDLDTSKDELLLAAAHHDLPSLRMLLRSVSANTQDPDTGYTPLHAAVAACRSEEAPPMTASTNGQVNGVNTAAQQESIEYIDMIELAEKSLRILFQNGAIWKVSDNNNETPGCLAQRLGLTTLYELVVDAGVRAELLLTRLDEYQPLPDEDEAEDNEKETPVGTSQSITEHNQPSQNPSTTTNGNYLDSELSFSSARLLDTSNNAVTTEWQTAIMKRTAARLLPRPGLRILTIGHGTGIFDHLAQEHSPSAHHIIESNADILSKMRTDGWLPSPSSSSSSSPPTRCTNVTVHEGHWQDVLEELSNKGTSFDAIFFDTSAEPYTAFRDFFTDNVAGLLDGGGVWSFVHGLGADRQVCYDVYTKVVEMDLFEAGFDVEWEGVEAPRAMDVQGESVRRREWDVESYRLPLCRVFE